MCERCEIRADGPDKMYETNVNWTFALFALFFGLYLAFCAVKGWRARTKELADFSDTAVEERGWQGGVNDR